MAIKFFEEDIQFNLKEKNKHKNWLKSVIIENGATVGEINYIYCSDEFLYDMNIKYLNHDTYTDIITFDNSEKEEIVEGDIFISIERIRENARKNKFAFEEELRRVMSHGILHLLGYKDKAEQEKKEMREMEKKSMDLFEKP